MAAPRGVDDRVLGHDAQGGRRVAELEVEVDQQGVLGVPVGQADGQIGGDRRLAAPTLRGQDRDDLIAAVGSRGRRFPPAGRRVHGTIEDLAHLGLRRVGTHDVASPGPQDALHELDGRMFDGDQRQVGPILDRVPWSG